MIQIKVKATCEHCGATWDALMPVRFHYADGSYRVLAADWALDSRWLKIDEHGRVRCRAEASCEAAFKRAAGRGAR